MARPPPPPPYRPPLPGATPAPGPSTGNASPIRPCATSASAFLVDRVCVHPQVARKQPLPALLPAARQHVDQRTHRIVMGLARVAGARLRQALDQPHRP